MRNEEHFKHLANSIEFIAGKPYWTKVSGYAGIKVGDLAGHVDIHGYRVIKITLNKVAKSFKAHRIHWYQIYAECPPLIDHINRDKADNRIENLRVISNSDNTRNRKAKSSGTSRFYGVSYHKRDKIYQARASKNGEVINIGRYKSEIEAARARDSFIIRNGLDDFSVLNFKQ